MKIYTIKNINYNFKIITKINEDRLGNDEYPEGIIAKSIGYIYEHYGEPIVKNLTNIQQRPHEFYKHQTVRPMLMKDKFVMKSKQASLVTRKSYAETSRRFSVSGSIKHKQNTFFYILSVAQTDG